MGLEFTNQDVLAEVLAHACAGEYRVIEFRTTDGQTTVADITDHLLALERKVNSEFADDVGAEYHDHEYDQDQDQDDRAEQHDVSRD